MARDCLGEDEFSCFYKHPLGEWEDEQCILPSLKQFIEYARRQLLWRSDAAFWQWNVFMATARIFPSMRCRKKSKEMLPERTPEAAEGNTNPVEETRDYIIPSLCASCGAQINRCGDREQASFAAWSPPDFVEEIPKEVNSWRKSSRRAASISLK